MIEHLPVSDDYRHKRQALLEAEISLMEQCEQVAELRRSLPDGPALEDYLFQEGPADLAAGDTPVREVRLSDLLSGGRRQLVVVHFMYGGTQTDACPMCSMWADGYDAVARHIGQHADVVLVAKAEIGTLRELARQRGWSKLRLLSSAGNSFNADLDMEDGDGNQFPGVSVIRPAADGTPQLSYSACAFSDGHYRLLDLLTPVWNILDLTPGGRGDWMPGLDYG